jgi:hypothetical protein
LTKRLSNRWQALVGYTLAKNRVDNYSIDVSPNFLINANGNVTAAANADRPNQFKLTGMYLMPFHDVIVSGNFRSQQGPPFTRQISFRTDSDTQTATSSRRQHADRHADHDRSPGRKLFPFGGTLEGRSTSTTWPTPTRPSTCAR